MYKTASSCVAGFVIAMTIPFGNVLSAASDSKPPQQAPFPAITDWKSLTITLERTLCFGACPDYRVQIGADGKVSYIGRAFVAITGEHVDQVPMAAVRTLYEAFVAADFFAARDSYKAGITDNPTYTVSISFDGHTKTVVDYVGRSVGMPKEITTLEDAIDATAQTAKWVKGNDATIASLNAEKWNFRIEDDAHLGLIESAAGSGNASLVRDLLGLGVRGRQPYVRTEQRCCSGTQALDGDAPEAPALICASGV